jgi:FkbM family methyltransferase
MEGNECYKFATIRNYIDLTHADPVRVTIDIGANVGAVTRMMKAYFPDACVYACEAVADYAVLAEANTRDLDGVTVWQRAVTGEHLFLDDTGERRRPKRVAMRMLKGLPEAGPGWGGGSICVPEDSPAIAGGAPPRGYSLLEPPVDAVSLNELVGEVLEREHAKQIDLLKLDCEGCEHSSLGCATLQTLKRLRFIVGEYHGIERFYGVMERKLFRTHKVSLIGQRDLGAFFAERLDGTQDGILRFDKSGMLVDRAWLSARPIDWHLFNERYVPPGERYWHALA